MAEKVEPAFDAPGDMACQLVSRGSLLSGSLWGEAPSQHTPQNFMAASVTFYYTGLVPFMLRLKGLHEFLD